MTPQKIGEELNEMFGSAVQQTSPETWQVETNEARLLVLLSEDLSWLRLLVTIAPADEATAFLPQLMEANFDETQETRYALFQGVLWGVFQHGSEGLTRADFRSAIARLFVLQQQGLSDTFNRLAEQQIRQIIRAAKQQGQTLEATMQTLDRLYEEGVMGDIDLSGAGRSQVLDAWRYQLERLWNEEQ
ncbi:hypothetical protein [Leptolyngbya ohadii]|uniref:hypothetical protein n=1 Tax=Leptolyngbya ohadii TaxID=1962290 RepID=UPI000B5A1FEC|nr:hypothetical protein [Leptolyngbya ohadii]